MAGPIEKRVQRRNISQWLDAYRTWYETWWSSDSISMIVACNLLPHIFGPQPCYIISARSVGSAANPAFDRGRERNHAFFYYYTLLARIIDMCSLKLALIHCIVRVRGELSDVESVLGLKDYNHEN